MDRFWDADKVPSRMEQLQRMVMSGSRTSTNSCGKDVGRGSSTQDFGAEARMSRRRSVAVTGAKVGRGSSAITSLWDVMAGVGRDGALVELTTFNRRVVGSTPTLAVT